MAYKDILVYLDPTAESVERLRFAVDLAKAHGARLIGVDVSAPEAGEEGPEVATRRMFERHNPRRGSQIRVRAGGKAWRRRRLHPLRRSHRRARPRAACARR